MRCRATSVAKQGAVVLSACLAVLWIWDYVLGVKAFLSRWTASHESESERLSWLARPSRPCLSRLSLLSSVNACQNYPMIGVRNADIYCNRKLFFFLKLLQQQNGMQKCKLRLTASTKNMHPLLGNQNQRWNPICAYIQEIFPMSGDKNRKQQEGPNQRITFSG